MKNLMTISLLILATNVFSQNIVSVDSTFQDPIERKAYIFQYLDLSDTLCDIPASPVLNLDDVENNAIEINTIRNYTMQIKKVYSQHLI